MLRAHLRYFNIDRQLRSILVTSAARGEGKTTVALSLAASAARAGLKVLLVETDFHRPSLGRVNEVIPVPGLSEGLSGQKWQIQGLSTGTGPGDLQPGRLRLVLAGSRPPNPAKLLASSQMSGLLKQWADEYDLVVIDSPPILRVADPIPLLGQVDGVLLVGQVNKTTRDEATGLSDQLRRLRRTRSWASSSTTCHLASPTRITDVEGRNFLTALGVGRA